MSINEIFSTAGNYPIDWETIAFWIVAYYAYRLYRIMRPRKPKKYTIPGHN